MSSPTPTGPELTVVLAALADADALETTLLHIRAQTVRELIEVLVVTPDRARLGQLPLGLGELHSSRVIEAPTARTGAQANAVGARAAAASVVVFAEDHAFPEPQWAAVLLDAHLGPWTAVGPVVVNANPETACSWADFVMGYGPWMAPSHAGPRPFLLGHNCSYKRDALLEAGDELEALLEAESVFHYRLAAEGHGLYLEPRARLAHVNFSRWLTALPVQFHAGRIYASSLREGWNRPRRIAYAVASPLIPFVRFAHCVRQIRERGRRGVVPSSVLPGLALGVLFDGAGQVAGHVAGAGSSEDRLAGYEFRRVDHVTSGDRRHLEALTASLRNGNA